MLSYIFINFFYTVTLIIPVNNCCIKPFLSSSNFCFLFLYCPIFSSTSINIDAIFTCSISLGTGIKNSYER